MRTPYLELVLAIALPSSIACAPRGAAAPPPVEPTSITTVTAAEVAPTPNAAPAPAIATAPEAAPAPFEPIPPSSERVTRNERKRPCSATGGGGKIDVRVGTRGLTATPGPSLDPRDKDCAFDALSPVPLNETASVGAPGIPPSGFTSLITVAW